MMEIVRLYKAGQSITQIATKFGVSRTTIHKKLRQHTQLRPAVHRTHQINISNLIDTQTEICAYWLGYLACRGSFQKTRITLRLPVRDIKHLGKWAEALQSSFMPTKKEGRCRLSVNSTELAQFYRQSGVPEFKTGDPTHLPPLTKRHLLRGLWDGSGVITRSSRYLRMGFTSKHIAVVEYVSELLSDVVGANKIDRRGKFYMWWCGKPALAVAKYLYFNQTVSLDRNTSKVLNYLLVQK
jgi:DNA-binding CsgD family transcriptional regulator